MIFKTIIQTNPNIFSVFREATSTSATFNCAICLQVGQWQTPMHNNKQTITQTNINKLDFLKAPEETQSN